MFWLELNVKDVVRSIPKQNKKRKSKAKVRYHYVAKVFKLSSILSIAVYMILS